MSSHVLRQGVELADLTTQLTMSFPELPQLIPQLDHLFLQHPNISLNLLHPDIYSLVEVCDLIHDNNATRGSVSDACFENRIIRLPLFPMRLDASREERPLIRSQLEVFQLSPGNPPLSDQEVVETQVLKFIRTRVGRIGTKINIFVGRIRTRKVVPSRGETIPVVEGRPHDERARRGNGLVSIALSRHDRRVVGWLVCSCVAGRVAH